MAAPFSLSVIGLGQDIWLNSGQWDERGSLLGAIPSFLSGTTGRDCLLFPWMLLITTERLGNCSNVFLKGSYAESGGAEGRMESCCWNNQPTFQASFKRDNKCPCCSSSVELGFLWLADQASQQIYRTSSYIYYSQVNLYRRQFWSCHTWSKTFIFPPQSYTLKINASIQDQALLSKVICFPSSSLI